jgi:hypothetical protein
MEPQRTEASPVICCCRLSTYDSCGQHTSGPDEPICIFCVDAGHPEQPNFDPIIKNARSNS